MRALLGSGAVTEDAAGPLRSRPWQIASLLLLVVALVLTVDHPPRVIGPNDARIYIEAAEAVAQGEYASDSEPSGVPRYPPGFPLMLSPFVAAWGDDGARAATILWGAALVGLVWLAAKRIAGDRGAAIAAILWSLSPMLTDYSTDVMSDPAGAGFVVLAFLWASSERWVLSGLALAWSGWIRLIHVVFLGGLLRHRRAWLAAALLLIPLGVFQLRTYGRLAGYDGGGAEFSLSHIGGPTPLMFFDRPSPWPNWQFFPGLLWGLQSGLVPMLPLFAGFEIFSRRSDPSVQLAGFVIVANVAIYLPYYYQAPRFVLPAACLVVVFAAGGIARVIDATCDGRRAEIGQQDEHP